MLIRSTVFALSFLAAAVSPVAAGEAPTLKAGKYEVSMRLELPHLDQLGVSKVTTICVTGSDSSGSRGLVVLSDNNPLAQCPASNFRQSGNVLTFDINCPGGKNQAVGSATYTLADERFDGRIVMKMGGKNMTMTETQSGHRVGDCDGVAQPHS